MAKDGEFDVGFGLDTSAANAELSKLRQQLGGVGADLIQTQKTLEKRVNDMVGKLTTAFDKIEQGTARYSKNVQNLESQFGRSLGSASRGGVQGQKTDAAARSVIADARNTSEQVTARITDALVNAFGQRLRTMDKVVEARMANEMRKVDQILANSSARFQNAQNILADRRRERAMYSAQNGAGAAANRDTRERMMSNGGADLMGIQSQLMVNYSALSLAFSAARNLSTFVVQLDKEFRQFQAITATTNFEMGGLKDRLIEVSEASKFTALEVAQAATVMGQAGLSAREVADSIGAVTMLATAAGTDLTEAVDVVTSTMSIFNLQATQAGDIANTLTAALNLSKLSIDKLALGFQYAGNTAAQMGITYQELTGVMGALANSGIRSGSTLGTGLRQLLIDIQNPTEKFSKTLKELKLSQEDVNVESNGLMPVLKRLKDAGFGSAEAFESFEVRAAAAFAALTNNIDLAGQLQQQFMLSTAAVQANETQMESLANTYAKFQSVVGTVAYKAFDPLIQVLQDVINGVADAIAVLNQFPGVMNVVAIAATALGTALALSTAGALFRGLAQNIPLLATFTVGMNAATASTTAMGVATATTTGLLTRLLFVLKSHPFLLIATGIMTGAMALYAMRDASGEATDRIDTLAGVVNTFKGEVDAASGQIEAINQTIANLIKQKKALDADPLMRTNKIMEVKMAFKEIAGEVDTTTGSVQELIEALRRLATEDFGKMSSNISKTIAANDELIAGYRDRLQNAPEQSRRGLNDQAEAMARLTGRDLNETVYTDHHWQARLMGEMAQAFKEIFGDEIGGIARIGLGLNKLPSDVNEAMALPNVIDQRVSELNTRSIELRGKTKLTPEEAQLLASLPDQLAMLEALKAGLEPMVQASVNIATKENENNILRGDLTSSKVKGTVAFRNLQRSSQAISGDLDARLREMASTISDPRELRDALIGLEAEFAERLMRLQTTADEMVDTIANEEGLDPQQVRAALQQEVDGINTIGKRIAARASEQNQLWAKVQADVLADDLDTVEREIRSATQRARDATSKEERDLAKEFLLRKFDERRRITDSVYQNKLDAEPDTAKHYEITSERAKAQRQINLEEQTLHEDFASMQVDSRIDQLQGYKTTADNTAKELRSEIDQLITEIGRSAPGEKIAALKAQIEALGAALDTQVQLSNSYDMQIMGLQSGGIPVAPDVAGRASQMMQFYTTKGNLKPHQAAALVGHAMAESNLNPEAWGDNGTSYGLFQHHKDRRRGLVNFANRRGQLPSDFQTQMEFPLHEFQNNEKDAYARLMAAQNVEEAVKALMYFERPAAQEGAPDDYLKRGMPQLGMGYGKRLGYATTLAQGTYKYDDTAADVAAAEYSQVLKALKADSNVKVRNASERIQTLSTQANYLEDPDQIKAIIESVNEAYKTIIAEKLRVFDEENKDTLASGDPAIKEQRDELIRSLRADQAQKISQLYEDINRAYDTQAGAGATEAQLRLNAANDNANNFTGAQIIDLENNLKLAEYDGLLKSIAFTETQLRQIRQEIAVAEATGNEEQKVFLLNEEARAKQKLVELERQRAAIDGARSAAPGLGDAVASGTNQWMVQNGIKTAGGEMVSLAKQVEDAWAGTLNVLSNGFAELFVDLASGTMSAGEAFKKFGLSVVQYLMQAIAKALALKLVMSLLGLGGLTGGGGGSDFLGSIMGGLFGTGGMALGGQVRGAALGEVIGGGVPGRDSVLRRLMPGEMVLRQSAVSAIGEGTLSSLNNLGNRRMSDPLGRQESNNQAGGGTVNVWVVSPDQVPPPGPKDIIATIANDIKTRGPVKQLIKQVAMGQI